MIHYVNGPGAIPGHFCVEERGEWWRIGVVASLPDPQLLLFWPTAHNMYYVNYFLWRVWESLGLHADMQPPLPSQSSLSVPSKTIRPSPASDGMVWPFLVRSVTVSSLPERVRIRVCSALSPQA